MGHVCLTHTKERAVFPNKFASRSSLLVTAQANRSSTIYIGSGAFTYMSALQGILIIFIAAWDIRKHPVGYLLGMTLYSPSKNRKEFDSNSTHGNKISPRPENNTSDAVRLSLTYLHSVSSLLGVEEFFSGDELFTPAGSQLPLRFLPPLPVNVAPLILTKSGPQVSASRYISYFLIVCWSSQCHWGCWLVHFWTASCSEPDR